MTIEQQPTRPDIEDPARELGGWLLNAAEVAATQVKVDKINQRASKRGLTGGLTLETTRVVETVDGVERVLWRARVLGEPPSIGGWSFLAAVDTLSDDRFVLNTPPGMGEEHIDRSVLQAGQCQHCGTHRRRVHTYLVRHEDGTTMQVGKSCLADFIGIKTLPVVFFEKPDDDFFGMGGETGVPREVTVRSALAHTWAAVQEHGWVSRSAAAGTMATADLVADALFGNTRRDRELREILAPHLERGAQHAETVIRELPDLLDGHTTYERNLLTLLGGEYVEARHLGLLCSAIATYERRTSQEQEAARRREEAEQIPNEWQGSIGEKITLSGTITREMTFEGYRHNSPASRLIILTAPHGIAKMFTTAAWAYDVNRGDEVTVTGTVKAHETYNGTRQTVLTRPKIG